MDNNTKMWLYDILNAIMEIESFFVESPKEFFLIIRKTSLQKEQLKGILKLNGY